MLALDSVSLEASSTYRVHYSASPSIGVEFFFFSNSYCLRYLGAVSCPSYFSSVGVGELGYEVSKGLSFYSRSGVKVHFELSQLDRPLEEPT